MSLYKGARLFCIGSESGCPQKAGLGEILKKHLQEGQPFLLLPNLCETALCRPETLRSLSAGIADAVGCAPRAMKSMLRNAGAGEINCYDPSEAPEPPVWKEGDADELLPLLPDGFLLLKLSPEMKGDAGLEACFVLADAGRSFLYLPSPTCSVTERGEEKPFDSAEALRGLYPLVESAQRHWHPVIDYERCSLCMRCLGFCLFGVFSSEENRPKVTAPSNCKPGCPACARICPDNAIIFPRHLDPDVNGRTSGGKSPRALDELLKGDVMEALKKRNSLVGNDEKLKKRGMDRLRELGIIGHGVEEEKDSLSSPQQDTHPSDEKE